MEKLKNITFKAKIKRSLIPIQVNKPNLKIQLEELKNKERVK